MRGADIIQPDICVVGGLLEMRKIAALAEAHFVIDRAAQPDGAAGDGGERAFLRRAAELPDPRIPAAARAGLRLRHRQRRGRRRRPALQGAWYVKDPYLPKDGYLELRPDRPGWGVEMDKEVLGTEDYVHWERKVPVKPDGSTGYV